VRRGRKAQGLNYDKMAELPKDVMVVGQAFLFAKKGGKDNAQIFVTQGIRLRKVIPDNEMTDNNKRRYPISGTWDYDMHRDWVSGVIVF